MFFALLNHWKNMKVKISSVLTSYTNGKKKFDVKGSSVEEVLNKLDETYPGIKFRFINEQDQIRSHMHIFVNKDQITNIKTPIKETDEIFITQALSGGLNGS